MFVSSDMNKINPLHLENVFVSSSLWFNGGSDALDSEVDLAIVQDFFVGEIYRSLTHSFV